MASPFSALHDLSALAATLSPSPVPTLPTTGSAPAPIPMHSISASHARGTRSSHTPPSETSEHSYSSTPSLSYTHSHSLSPYVPSLPTSYGTAANLATSLTPSSGLTATAGKEHRKHRRQSSSSGHRRRLSDARDALSMTARPFLTVESSPPAAVSQSVPASGYLSTRRGSTTKRESSKSSDDGNSVSPSLGHATTVGAIDANGAANNNGGKRIYICEHCQKVYRHRSCMDKHRWEHSPHWIPSSKFLLSKHQQVQLLEAAAILSHLKAPSRSLPEDRSLWPKYLAEVTGAAPGSGSAAQGRRMKAARWPASSANGRKSSVYDGESVMGEIDMDEEDDAEDVDVVGDDDRSMSGDVSASAMGADEDDEETEDEIEVVRPWEGVGGLEMEL